MTGGRARTRALMVISCLALGAAGTQAQGGRPSVARGEWPASRGICAAPSWRDGRQYIAIAVQGPRQGAVPEPIALRLP